MLCYAAGQVKAGSDKKGHATARASLRAGFDCNNILTIHS